jgi:Bacterial dnaA protein helix-turn-helix
MTEHAYAEQQQRRLADFALVLAYWQKELPPAPAFCNDLARLRWLREQYQAQCESAPAWASRGLILRRVAAAAFGIDDAVLISPTRIRPVVQARQQTMTFARIVCGWSTPKIGHLFARDHSTVVSAIEKYRALVEEALR